VITVEFIPDLESDPDAFRLHAEHKHEVEATPEMMGIVLEFERKLWAVEDAAERGGPDDDTA